MIGLIILHRIHFSGGNFQMVIYLVNYDHVKINKAIRCFFTSTKTVFSLSLIHTIKILDLKKGS